MNYDQSDVDLVHSWGQGQEDWNVYILTIFWRHFTQKRNKENCSSSTLPTSGDNIEYTLGMSSFNIFNHNEIFFSLTDRERERERERERGVFKIME